MISQWVLGGVQKKWGPRFCPGAAPVLSAANGQIFAPPRTAKPKRFRSIHLAMRFRLTPPGAPIFFVSLILAVAAVATLYTRVPLAGHYIALHRFWVMAAAYAALLAGVLFEGL